MSKKLATLTFGLLMLGTVFADEPVCRVQSISKVGDGSAPFLVQKKPKDPKNYPATLNSTGYVQDHYITDGNTVAALEFLIGGRVGINKNTDIEIIDARSVSDGKPVKRVVLKNGGLWVKAEAKSLKQPLEIQTNGGVMGIKGTEFTVETQQDGTDRVCCFESNSSQGGVEIRDKSGKVVGLAKPGEEYLLALKKAPVVTPHSDVQQFRQDTFNRGFSSFQGTPEGQLMLSGAAYVPYFGGALSMASGASYTVDAVANFERNPAAALAALWSTANSAAGMAGGHINTGGWGGMISSGLSTAASHQSNEKPKPEFPYDVSPDASPESKTTKETGAFPQLSWHGIDDVESYAVLISKDENLNEVVWMDQTKNTQINYPATARPLTPGKYFWRIVPLDGEDKPTKTGAQTYFTVK
ncbi:MAG: FecR domain-containing protein [Candidatus Eremiobacteraeota bacterium]|nr:FecR domain-containing protein [Candidatus Eremiobacteraeota bacterium]